MTIDYEVYTRRAPTAPTILRIRTDVSWEEVVREHSHHIRKNAPQTGMRGERRRGREGGSWREMGEGREGERERGRESLIHDLQ